MFSAHRSVLQQAWQTTWGHKHLWLLGIGAGLANTGGLLNITFRTFKRLSDEPTLRSYLEGSAPGVTTILLYAQKLALVSQARLGLTVAIIIISAIVLIVLALCAQAGLIRAIPLVDRNKKPGRFTHHPPALLGQLLTVDLLSRFSFLLLSLVTGFAMIHLATGTVAGDALVTFGLLLVFIPCSLLIGYLSIFGAIEVVVKGKGVLQGLADAWRVLLRHWFPLAELTVILFFINLLASLASVISVILFAVPYLLTLKTATVVGSNFLWLSTITIGAVTLVGAGLIIFGALTAFVYAAWYHAYEKFDKRRFPL